LNTIYLVIGQRRWPFSTFIGHWKECQTNRWCSRINLSRFRKY